jgi:glycosyltransferase involved in cell wall biosynthesis
MGKPSTGILHYTAPPIVGGVEAVIQAHTQVFGENGYPVTVVAGRGDPAALPPTADFITIPEIDSQHPQIVQMSAKLEQGRVAPELESLIGKLADILAPRLEAFDNLIVHNVLTKHFNLALTAALHRLIDGGIIRHCIAWCHDFTWTSPSSRTRVHPGQPWDLLRTYRQDVTYVVVSRRRQQELATLFGCLEDDIQVIYNGVAPKTLLGLSSEGWALIDRLDLIAGDPVLLMPVRVTHAKNIEYALQLVATLKAQGRSPRLVVTGPPDPHDAQSMAYFEELRAMRSRMQIDREMRFVFEAGPVTGEPYTVDMSVVGELFRMCDAVLMPSHREGFGMPILEAGLAGVPVICTRIPAAEEIGGDDVILFDADEDPTHLASRIMDYLESSMVYRLRRQVRQRYTWQALFEHQIEPLLGSAQKRKPGA